jgi:hypothetical protein
MTPTWEVGLFLRCGAYSYEKHNVGAGARGLL